MHRWFMVNLREKYIEILRKFRTVLGCMNCPCRKFPDAESGCGWERAHADEKRVGWRGSSVKFVARRRDAALKEVAMSDLHTTRFEDSGSPIDRPPALPEREQYLERWKREAEFEDEVRSLMQLLRPHRAETLLGWEEHRTKGERFRVTIAWDPRLDVTCAGEPLCVPRMVEVLEAILVGSAKQQDRLDPQDEFDIYAAVVRELAARLVELRSRYE